jgi:hypothetical protein
MPSATDDLRLMAVFDVHHSAPGFEFGPVLGRLGAMIGHRQIASIVCYVPHSALKNHLDDEPPAGFTFALIHRILHLWKGDDLASTVD